MIVSYKATLNKHTHEHTQLLPTKNVANVRISLTFNNFGDYINTNNVKQIINELKIHV